MIRHHPKRDEEGEEGEDMDEQDDTLSQRKLMSSENVEADGQEGEGEEEQGDLPIFNEFRVGVADGNHFLNHSCHLDRTGWNSSNPPNGRCPSHDVRERLLH